MTRFTLRRVLAVLASGAVGVITALAAAAPAHAARSELTPTATRLFGCSGTNVYFVADPAVDWTVTVGGEVVFPLAGDSQPGAGEAGHVYVPYGSGEISVDYAGSPETDEFPVVIREPAILPPLCDEIPDIAVTQPTCDQTGQIAIPAADEFPIVGIPADAEKVFTIDGAPVPLGSVQPVSPGTHTVVFDMVGAGIVVGSDLVRLPHWIEKVWTVTIDEPDCPVPPQDGETPPQDDETPPQDENPPQDEEQPPAETDPAVTTSAAPSGSLPVTGFPIGPVAAGAVLIIAVGVGLFLLARRRTEDAAPPPTA